MKDTTIYDFVHHQHQQHSQQHHHQQQWNHPQQQQQQLQRHLNTSLYGNQSGNHQQHHQQHQQHGQQVQRNAIGQQQHHHNHQSQQHMSQYHHNNNQQQFQPAAHHNNSAYYQQPTQAAAHLYSNYQAHSDQQQSNSNVRQHGHQPQQHDSSNLTASAAPTETTTNGAVVAGQQLATNNTQQPPDINTNWSSAPGGAVVPSLVAQHLVLNEHTQVPGYITHSGYHSGHNNSTTTTEHRNHSNVPVSSQSTLSATNGIQDNALTNSYAPVNPMYNITMGSAAETYGYSNYNAGFFQASPNNSSHNPQTVGHPSNTANISTFWNHNQPSHHHQTQQQASIGNQTNSIPQRLQPITTTEQNNAIATGNYVHDPRLYYGRPAAYSQSIHNYLQPQVQPSDVVDQGTSSNTLQSEQHQNQHVTQNELSQIPIHNQQHHSPSQTSTEVRSQLSSNQQNFNSTASSNNYPSVIDGSFKKPVAIDHNNSLQNNLTSSVRTSPQHNQKQAASTKIANNDSIRPTDSNKQISQINRDKNKPKEPHNLQVASQTSEERTNIVNAKNINRQNAQKLLMEVLEKPSANCISQSKITTIKKEQMNNEPKTVIHELPDHYLQKPTQISSQPVGVKESNDEIDATVSSNNKDEDINKRIISKSHANELKQQSPPNRTSLEDGIASLSLSPPRKTTWASIASQPAKISQPKSLKSKIAGSNSVLSTSAKHHLAAAAAAAAASTASLDTSNLDIKNGINPAIKSSVSAVTTSIQVRNSMPPPASRLPSVVASLKLDLLGKDSIETSKISWPAVNASIDLTKDIETSQAKNNPDTTTMNFQTNGNNNSYNSHKCDNEDFRPSYKDRVPQNRDHQNSYQLQQQEYKSRGIGREPFWSHRNEQRDSFNRDRRDYPRRVVDDSKNINGIIKTQNEDTISVVKLDKQNFNPERQEPVVKDTGPVVVKHHNHDYRNGLRGNNHNQYNRSYNNNFDFDDRQNHNQLIDKSNQVYNSRPHFPQHRNENNHTQNNHHNDNTIEANTKNMSHSKKNLPQLAQVDSTNFNPKTFNLDPVEARYFIIKSYSEDDIHRSIKYSIWTSTNHGNQKLDQAYRQQKQRSKDASIYLFFSVNASGHFCGMAEMMSAVDFNSSSGVWAQSKWQGEFKVKWIYVKDVPNMALRHITLENNEDKPVTNSRDTQEVFSEKGKAVLKIIHEYQHSTSLFDDFQHYERRQEEERYKKNNGNQQQQLPPQPYNLQIRNDRGYGGRPIAGGFQNYRPYSKSQRGHF